MFLTLRRWNLQIRLPFTAKRIVYRFLQFFSPRQNLFTSKDMIDEPHPSTQETTGLPVELHLFVIDK